MLLKEQLKPLVDAITEKKKITFFLGAGISTSCGIPDFRSPETGLYANLKRLNLPYAEAVFDIDYFRESPKAFYTLCDELYPGKFKPSKFHYLLKLFQQKRLLQRVYTQNIDTLERIAGVDDTLIVEAHGSFAKNHCIDCKNPMSVEDLKAQMINKESNEGVPVCAKCSGYVKPDIVFFGEGLPERFFEMWEKDSEEVEVAIVAGTSLTVYPFALLPAECGKKSLRILVNKEVVGDFKAKKRKSDIIIQRECDAFALELAEQLGWSKELDSLIQLVEQNLGDKKYEKSLTNQSGSTKVALTDKKEPDQAKAPQESGGVRNLEETLEKLQLK